MSLYESKPIADYRLSLNQIHSIKLTHLFSNVTRNHLDVVNTNTISTIEGYTEWISTSIPLISIGWDWTAKVHGLRLAYRVSGFPYSNITLINDSGKVLTESAQLSQLRLLIKHLDWKETVARHITN